MLVKHVDHNKIISTEAGYDDTFYQLRCCYIDEIIKKCSLFSTRVKANISIEDMYHLNQEIFRTIHSIKGSSPMYEIGIIGNICHRFEDLLSANTLIENVKNPKYTERLVDFLELISATAFVEKNHTLMPQG